MNSMSEAPSGVTAKAGIKGGASMADGAYMNGNSQRNLHPSVKSNNGSSNTTTKKTKKRGSRRRGENEIYKAADTSVNAQSRLESLLFPKASYVVRMPISKGLKVKHPVVKEQFEDATETAERQLRQNRLDAGGSGRPAFGYFSLHPSTLMLHPPHAVHLYYPSTPIRFNSFMRSPPPINPNGAAGQSQYHVDNMVMHNQLQNQNQQQNHLQQNQQHPGTSPKVPQIQRSMQQHRPGMPAMSPQQQAQMQRSQQQQHPGFLEFARKRQQQQQEHMRQQEALKLQQTESIQQEQLRALQQSHQQRTPREKRHIEQLQQQQENTAAVLASMRTNPSQQVAAAHAAQMKASLMPRAHGGMPEGLSGADKEPGSMAHLALEAKFLGHLAQAKESTTGQMYPFMASQMAHQQQQRSPAPHAQESMHSSPQPPPKSSNTTDQQPPRRPQILAPTASEDASLDENGAGAKQFVKRMITTSEESPLTTGMDQLETLPMLLYTPPDTKKEFPVREQEITNCDVLLGRGGMTNHHVGNMHFRTLVSSFRLHYCAAKKGDKGRLSKKLTNFVRHKNGRFLQKDDVDNLWYEVGDSRAHGKCAQALREGTADLNRQVATGTAFETTKAPDTGAMQTTSAMPSYPTAYAVRPPGVAPPTTGSASPSMSKYREADIMHRAHAAMMPHHARMMHHPPYPPYPSHYPSSQHPQHHQQRPQQHQQQGGGVPAAGDQSSPRCVTRPTTADANSKNSTSRAGPSPVEKPPQPLPPKRPLANTENQSDGEVQKPAVVAPTQGSRPAVMTDDDEGPGNVERPMSRKSYGTRSEEKSGGQYDDDDDESTMEEEELKVEKEDPSRKRMKVQHVEDHFDYI